MDTSAGDSYLQSSALFSRVPPEAQAIIQSPNHSDNCIYLTTLSTLSLEPSLTALTLQCYQPIFADLVSRWPSLASPESMASAFGRILPLQPYLIVYAEKFLNSSKSFTSISHLSPGSTAEELGLIPPEPLIDLLLSLFRLLTFRKEGFVRLVELENILPLQRHPARAVQYLAIRVLCICLNAAEHATEEMIKKHLGEEPVIGIYEGYPVDYCFLSLLETKRLSKLATELGSVKRMETSITIPRNIPNDDLSPMVANLCGVMIPRIKGPSPNPPTVVLTPATVTNIRMIATAMRSAQPILITGPAGAGKSFLIHEIAELLNEESSLVSVHLGDQTDAKLLIGAYTTGDTPGSFEWRPGVLTTAVREGRWVLVEDIDKAPTDVLSVLLPLMENGELHIPSRGETIIAGRGFRLIATMRTTVSTKMETTTVNILGSRLWNRIDLPGISGEELHTIIQHKFSRLSSISPTLLNVYKNVVSIYREPAFFAVSKTSLGRQVSPRDLFKWCTRVDVLFASIGFKEKSETITDQLYDEIFMEAVDCFAGSLQTSAAKEVIVKKIGEEMHIAPTRVELYLNGHVPYFRDSDKTLNVGRVKLTKRKKIMNVMSRNKGESRPFAVTGHALRLIEQVGVAVRQAEPVLLVGETGTGKTTAVQHLADLLRHNLTVINLSQQTESGDLLGGYKPVDVRTLAVPLKDSFEDLFESTFSIKRNARFMEMLNKCFAKQQWTRVIALWKEAVKRATDFFAKPLPAEVDQPKKKRRKVDEMDRPGLQAKWLQFENELASLERQSSQSAKSFAFSFVEGSLVRAARNGDWVLLDEINLAAPDTLESIGDLLKEGGKGSILLSEKGSVERVDAHPNFRIFGCMNPATDVGKRDLPSGLRSRFTELYVASPDGILENLIAIVTEYIGHLCLSDERAPSDVARLYLVVKALAEEHRLVDGAGQKAHFSLRTLTRTLMYVNDISPVYGLRRSLYEGFCMSFLTLLDQPSEELLQPVLEKHLLGEVRNIKSLINQIPKRPESHGVQYVQLKHYWMPRGELEVQEQSHYIITPFVEKNLVNLVRATATKRFPVLIQGPTSSGKTSMIEYLAKHTGHHFVRINNHEHTDLQEYLGTYVSDNVGKLRFQEGILVEALRKGYWLVLDELNLAPTDVLEALNRLLDDNRELLIPETQEVVRPHNDFMLFATQNPPGLYGGRKVLSRAFRNRFLELHFLDIPEDELEIILRERCQIAPSYCKKIVAVYKELSVLRQTTRLFESKNSFATLRDLFRWANREAVGYQRLAENGFMLLAERVRRADEKLAVKGVIEKVMKVKVNEEALYAADAIKEFGMYSARQRSGEIVWTKAMRRLYALVSEAIRNNEPVLLVGDTGCGKTTVCQMLAQTFDKELLIVNAHQNTETGDIIGAQRPIRNRSGYISQLHEDLHSIFTDCLSTAHFMGRHDVSLEELVVEFASLEQSQLDSVPPDLLERIQQNRVRTKALFEWNDGSLVNAMKRAQFFLLDEISLADDSVLERLNSVLESGRTILLAEKGPEKSHIVASEGFQFFATMNPGGDYGKKELSPALRNRFTEIWVPAMADLEDVLQIVNSKLAHNVKDLASPIVQFANWYSERYGSSTAASISIRDVLSWASFINSVAAEEPSFALLHGAALVFIDSIGANPSAVLSFAPEDLHQEKQKCIQHLSELIGQDLFSLSNLLVSIYSDDQRLTAGPFSLPKKSATATTISFNLEAPTTAINAMRVVRAMQLRKPVLLEGSPGVGKTSLVSTLAAATGNPLTRINLSEQTDLMDLFGSDVPVERGQSGEFEWRDAPFLRAMQQGQWVLLDEMNLASQSVLEGLNACLDHRGEAYIAELDRTFTSHPNFVVFAAQNPHHQGGGRKGLPASFVNRFTVVYVETLNITDLEMISARLYPSIPESEIKNAITFVVQLNHEVSVKRSFGTLGSPWEFNLRDTLRWLQLLSSTTGLIAHRPASEFLDVIFKRRFRTVQDRSGVDELYQQIFMQAPGPRKLYYQISKDWLQVGHAVLFRKPIVQQVTPQATALLTQQLNIVESTMDCVQQNWPCILVGPSGCGKSSVVKLLAAITGAKLDVLPLNADVDTIDIVGGFEQVDVARHISTLVEDLREFTQELTINSLQEGSQFKIQLLRLLTAISNCSTFANAEILSHLTSELRLLAQDIEEFIIFVEKFEILTQEIQKPSIARFEWVDGTLVRAVEEGRWLVLDNANLCSASVLDRLNSLLEPDGKLIINEHSDSNGQPRMVQPHPDFRLFITMDPRHGELSRAMRNRGIEVFMDTHEAADPVTLQEDERRMELANLSVSPAVDSTTSIFHLIDSSSMLGISLNHLPMDRLYLLNRWKAFVTAIKDHKDDSIYDFPGSHVDALAEYTELFSHHQLRKMMNDFLTFSSQEMSIAEMSFMSAQPFHPLVNSALLFKPSKYPMHLDPYNLATYYDLLLDILKMRHIENGISQKAAVTKLGEMTFLERSASNSHGRSSKGAGAPLFEFLSGTLRALEEWSNSSPVIEKHTLNHIGSFTSLWRDLIKLSNTIKLDESVFQVYLEFLREWLESSKAIVQSPLLDTVRSHLAAIGAQLKLATGFSMETMWLHMRPSVPKSLAGWESHLQLVALAGRFDTVVPQFTGSLEEITNLRMSLATALSFSIISEDQLVGLIEELNSHISKLEKQSELGQSRKRQFFFKPEFNHILKSRDLRLAASTQAVNLNGDIIVNAHFAGRSTSSLVRYGIAGSKLRTAYEPILEDFWVFQDGSDIKYGPSELISGQFGLNMLSSQKTITSCSIEQLPALQSELHLLGKQIVLSNQDLFQNHLVSVNLLLLSKLQTIVQIHKGTYGAEEYQKISELYRRLRLAIQTRAPYDIINDFSCLRDLLTSTKSSQFLEVVDDHLVPAFKALTSLTISGYQESFRLSGAAWVDYSLGCLKLYVPSCAFDPAMKPIVHRGRYLTKKAELTEHVNTHRHFQLQYNGQSESALIQHLENQILELGDEPPDSSIARPQESQMETVQGDMLMILRTVVHTDIPSRLLPSILERKPGYREEEELFQENLGQIIDRLYGYPLYKDLVDPLIGFLYSLRLGLSIAGTEVQGDVPILSSFLEPAQILCLTSGGLSGLKSSGSGSHMYFLWNIVARSRVESIDRLEQSTKELIHHELQRLFEEWKIKEMKEKEKAAANASLYRYKGAEEDDDEAMVKEMFPDYENDMMPEVRDEKRSQKETASEIARCHTAMLFPENVKGVGLRDLLSRGLSLCNKEVALQSSKGAVIPVQLETILPGHVLALRDSENWLSGKQRFTEKYDFYKDENLEQAQRLVAITEKIQIRILNLIEAWPENVTLQDAYDMCQQVVNLPITTPVAKFLAKIEKLHFVLNEWQGIASSKYSVAEEYDALTALTISWRRLELQAWPRLFDIEDEKCQLDANSWWFFFYQSIIYNPVQLLASGENLNEHILQLIQALRLFMNDSTIGQFKTRLQLLRVFRQHLKKLVDTSEYPQLQALGDALDNLISYFSEYTSIATERISQARTKVGKEIADVILLASWKDTNIVALRESARRSHYKLYKIVQRYRRGQNDPMLPVMQGGMPEVPLGTQESIDSSIVFAVQANLELAQSICSRSVDGWEGRSKRLLDIQNTISSMKRITLLPSDFPVVPNIIETYSTQVISTIKELQSETASFLTEENKDEMKHLKSRKRKAYIDALKDLKAMGLKANLSGNHLAKIDSVERIFAETAPLDAGSPAIHSATKYYLRILEAFQKVRNIRQEHSADLTGNEVNRSVGYIEHLLYLANQQRNDLGKYSLEYDSLKSLVAKYQLLASSLEEPGAELYGETTADNWLFVNTRRMYLWLPELVDLALEGVKAYTSFSGIKLDSVEDLHKEWKTKAVELCQRFKEVSLISEKIWDSSTKNLMDTALSTITTIRQGILRVQNDYPNIAYITKQILPWLSITSNNSSFKPTNNHTPVLTITDLDTSLQSLCNSIFVALQQLKESHSQFPTAIDDQGWFIKFQGACTTSLKALHINEINRKLGRSLDSLLSLQPYTPQKSQTIRALFAVCLPIIQQFQVTCSENLDRLATFHRAASKMTYVLCTSTVTLGTKGFCTPPEQSDDKGDATGVEQGGTGLGDGEGMEDISKDIGADEDLSEIAQEKQKEEDKNRDMKNEDDAVDIEDEMEGEMGDMDEEGDKEEEDKDANKEEDEENEMDEETGDVDDLDPTAVDEKLWDDKGDEDAREKEGGDTKGKEGGKDEMEAKTEDNKEKRKDGKGSESPEEQDEMEEEEEAGADENDEVRPEEKGIADTHIPEIDTLDLPDDMDLDKDEDDKENKEEDGDMEMGDMSDVADDDKPMEDDKTDSEQFPETAEENGEDETSVDDKSQGGEEDNLEKQDNGVKDDEEEGEDAKEHEQSEDFLKQSSDEAKSASETAPSEAQGVDTGGEQQQDSNQSTSARQETGEENSATESQGLGKDQNQSAEQQQGQGSTQEMDTSDQQHRDSEEQQPKDNAAFRKLGDALEKWHRQQRDIGDAQKEEERQQVDNMDMQNSEFEHLPDADAEADTQALGSATQEQAHSVDDAMAVDQEAPELPPAGFEEDEPSAQSDPTANNEANPKEGGQDEPKEGEPENAYAGAMIGNRDTSTSKRNQNSADTMDIDDTSLDTSSAAAHALHPNPDFTLTTTRPHTEARALWQHYEQTTRDLSLGLCEQLRLILEPTLATKMRGDFRTGKRLNMKRIIPYIASQYKKDKIWMRRTKPSKRTYQVMIALDDSKSMAESESVGLAFETITLIAKALSMLEVGQISIVSFGAEPRVVHPFNQPFTSDSGVKVFEQFTFSQLKTNVKSLIETSLSLFESAQSSSLSSSSSNSSICQLEIIISDGVCEDHATVQRLVRRCIEQRIMVVFVIVDAVRDSSILEMNQVKFETDEGGNMKLKMERYLDTFPFRYYLVVKDVKELPGVLALALRQWLQEVVESTQ